MSSTTLPPQLTVRHLVALVADARAAARAVAEALATDPALLAEVPDETLEALALDLNAARDAATAAATVVTGRVDRVIGSVRGKLVAGRYVSTSQFLVAEAGMAMADAKVMVGRGRALHRDYAVVADAWLAGVVPGGAVRALTQGVEGIIGRSHRLSTPARREDLLGRLLPIAASGDVSALEVAVRLERAQVDPDGCDEEALFAWQTQNLSLTPHGPMWRITGDLTPEVAAATMTALEAAVNQIVVEELGDLTHEPDCETVAGPRSGCTCGELDRARRAAGLRHDQLLARALGEHMTGVLRSGVLGSHHATARQVTVVADVTDASAPLIGRLAVPGSNDDALLPPATMSRLLCDADITRVLTVEAQVPSIGQGFDGDAAHERGRRFLSGVGTTLTSVARSVLYVGRSQRTVSARLRRALEVRDGHCVFPGCRAHVRRCEAHHVLPWEHGGPTDISNLATVCPAHHHALHEGGWTMALKSGWSGHESGCWDFTPPPLRRRRLQP